MSSLTNINLRPKLIPYLISNNSFNQKPLIVVDVGSRGGYEPHWNLFGDQIRILGFDPDEKDCRRLNRQNKNSNVYYYPYALWETIGIRNFYLMSNPPSSSFFKPKQNFWERFPDEVNLKVKKVIRVKTVTLDSFAEENNLSYIDFIKLDIEGAELSALKGAQRLLKKSILGVTCEIVFDELCKNQPTFCDIDVFLKGFGFRLFDLGLFRKLRKTLSSTPELTPIGQVITGHALYFRDGTAEIISKSSAWRWGEIKVLKLASLMELFGLADCAIELIQVAKKNGLLKRYSREPLENLLSKSVKKMSDSGFFGLFK